MTISCPGQFPDGWPYQVFSIQESLRPASKPASSVFRAFQWQRHGTALSVTASPVHVILLSNGPA